MTLRSIFAAIGMIALVSTPAIASDFQGEKRPSMIYQIRTYTTAPEKLDVLVDRFDRVNLPLFDRHGITLVGAWIPHESDTEGDRLVYLVAFANRESADRSWESFLNDPEWIDAFAQEQSRHANVVTGVQTVFLEPTDYSPVPLLSETQPDDNAAIASIADEGELPRLFELRRYVASPGKLDDLNARFRDHTMELFVKHGMTNVIYTMPTDEADEDGSVLLYFVAHPNLDGATGAWESFRSDPDWNAVREASQPDGVPLAAKVESWMLVPTPFSPLK